MKFVVHLLKSYLFVQLYDLYVISRIILQGFIFKHILLVVYVFSVQAFKKETYVSYKSVQEIDAISDDLEGRT